MRRSPPTTTWVSVAVTLLAIGALVTILATRRATSSAGPAGAAPNPAAVRQQPADQAAQGTLAFPSSPQQGSSPPIVRPHGALAKTATLATRILTRELGPLAAPGQSRVMDARCANGACVIRYRADQRGAGRVLEDQALIFRQLFADPRVRTVTLLVHHTAYGRGHTETLPFLEETCDRAATRRIDFNAAAAQGILAHCNVISRTGAQALGSSRGGPPQLRGPSVNRPNGNASPHD
jgi:hypothetical protein